MIQNIFLLYFSFLPNSRDLENDYTEYMRLKNIYPTKLGVVRYEDLIQDPVNAAKQVSMDFCIFGSKSVDL